MMRSRIRFISETIAFLGVIASLVFVGLQIRQSAAATRAATAAGVADGFRDLNLVLASSPELAKALATYAADPVQAPKDAQIQILGLWRALFHIWSNTHRQYVSGTLDPRLFQAVVQEISLYAGDDNPDVNQSDRRKTVMRWAWSSERFLFSPDFQAVVDSILAGDPVPGLTRGR